MSMRPVFRIIQLTFLVAFFVSGCVTTTRPEWSRAEGCFALIKNGSEERVISDAKSIIKDDRWNADAQACLVMAYYSSNRRHLATKKLNEAVDTIPKEQVEKIHDILWEFVPEFLAEREYSNNYTINGGDCLLRNVKALKGNGLIIIGRFYDPKESRAVRHVMGYRCRPNIQKCEDIDLTCPDCTLLEPEAVIVINDFRVADIQHLMSERPISRNIKYIKRILEIENGF